MFSVFSSIFFRFPLLTQFNAIDADGVTMPVGHVADDASFLGVGSYPVAFAKMVANGWFVYGEILLMFLFCCIIIDVPIFFTAGSNPI